MKWEIRSLQYYSGRHLKPSSGRGQRESIRHLPRIGLSWGSILGILYGSLSTTRCDSLLQRQELPLSITGSEPKPKNKVAVELIWRKLYSEAGIYQNLEDINTEDQ